jgi:hypothetical protein
VAVRQSGYRDVGTELAGIEKICANDGLMKGV